MSFHDLKDEVAVDVVPEVRLVPERQPVVGHAGRNNRIKIRRIRFSTS
jgi:hypothetical protein